MSEVLVYAIVDLLSEKVTNVFYAPNVDFALRAFGNFLDGLKGRVTPSDFAIMCCGCVDSVPESYDEAINMAQKEKKFAFMSGVDCLRALGDSEDESKR